MRTTIVVLVVLIVAPIVSAASESAHRQIIPVVAHVEGLDGSVWRTDVVIHNPTDETARVSFEVFSKQDQQAVIHGIEFSLESQETRFLPDALTWVPGMAATGNGWVRFTSTNVDHEPVPIVVDSRTWSEGAGGGTFGQGIPAVAWNQNSDLSEPERRIVGFEASERFRSNLGIVNLTSGEMIFLVTILDASGVEAARTFLRVEPFWQKQFNGILDDLGLDGGGFTAVVLLESWTGTSGAPDFVVYGSRIDRWTNDPTYIEGARPAQP